MHEYGLSPTAIVGYGEANPKKVPGKTSVEFCAEAAIKAMRDAQIKPSQIDAVFAGFTTVDPYPFFSAALCEFLGIAPKRHVSIHTGGAIYGQIFGQAMMAVGSGQCDVALVVHGDNRASGMSREETIARNAAGAGHPDYENPSGMTVPAAYALAAQRHMHLYGTTEEQLAAIAVNQRRNAALNPHAIMTKPITIDDVMNSRRIADPLKMLECCLVSDFAGAAIVTRADRAKDFPNPPVHLRGYGEFMLHEYIVAMPEVTETAARQSGEQAFRMAGMDRSDIDFVELYDCFSITPMLLLEDLGFCPKGEGGRFVSDPSTITLEGSLPMNTYGGMLSAANGGILHFMEAIRQIRGEAGERQLKRANTALVHAQGGVFATHATLILQKDL